MSEKLRFAEIQELKSPITLRIPKFGYLSRERRGLEELWKKLNDMEKEL